MQKKNDQIPFETTSIQNAISLMGCIFLNTIPSEKTNQIVKLLSTIPMRIIIWIYCATGEEGRSNGDGRWPDSKVVVVIYLCDFPLLSCELGFGYRVECNVNLIGGGGSVGMRF